MSILWLFSDSSFLSFGWFKLKKLFTNLIQFILRYNMIPFWLSLFVSSNLTNWHLSIHLAFNLIILVYLSWECIIILFLCFILELIIKDFILILILWNNYLALRLLNIWWIVWFQACWILWFVWAGFRIHIHKLIMVRIEHIAITLLFLWLFIIEHYKRLHFLIIPHLWFVKTWVI